MRRPQLARLMLLGAAAMFFLIAAAPLHAVQPADGTEDVRSFTLGLQSGFLAGRLEAGTPIADFVRGIGELGGFEVEVRGDPGQVRNPVSLEGLTIEAALKRIAPEQSLLISYVRRTPDTAALSSGFSGRAIFKIMLGSGTTVSAIAVPESAPVAEAPDPEVTRAIAQREIVALSYAADRSAIERLRNAALTRGDSAVRIAAISALAGVAGPESLALFTGPALTDADSAVRVEAARSIMRVIGERGRAIVEAAARSESDPAIREALQRLARGEAVAHASTASREPVTR